MYGEGSESWDTAITTQPTELKLQLMFMAGQLEDFWRLGQAQLT